VFRRPKFYKSHFILYNNPGCVQIRKNRENDRPYIGALINYVFIGNSKVTGRRFGSGDNPVAPPGKHPWPGCRGFKTRLCSWVPRTKSKRGVRV